jgi:Leucine-rich repeat (LRR) protein
LDNNRLSKFELKFDNLKYLSLKDNNIIDITYICKNNTKLKNLSLSNNHIEFIPIEIQNLSHLVILNLINNKLIDITNITNKIPLEYLFLDSNFLQYVNIKSNSIISLSLMNNYIKTIKINIKPLLTLNLQNNKINELSINKTAHIKYLNLNNSICNLKDFNKFTYKYINTLDISNNDLININIPFNKFISLKRLYIINTQNIHNFNQISNNLEFIKQR